jgi:hypothetical protein
MGTIVVLGLLVWSNVATFVTPMTEAQAWTACYDGDNLWGMHQCMLRKSDQAIMLWFMACTMDLGLVVLLVVTSKRWLWLIKRWCTIAMAYCRVHLRRVSA